MFGWDEMESGPAFVGAGGWTEREARGGPWGHGPWSGEPGIGHMMHHLRDFARRFPFGPGFFGPGMGPRMFGRGDLKYGLLKLLEERPKHGYEMIKELEDLSGGFYTPSAGAIYPTLQLLEDRGWVTVEVVEGKKVYTITDDGRAALAEHRQREEERPGPGFGPREWGRPERPERPERPHGPHHHHGPNEGFPWEARREMRTLVHEARGVAHLMRQAVLMSGGDPAQLQQIQAIIERARNDLTAFVQRQQERPGGSGAPSGSGPSTPPDDSSII